MRCENASQQSESQPFKTLRVIPALQECEKEKQLSAELGAIPALRESRWYFLRCENTSQLQPSKGYACVAGMQKEKQLPAELGAIPALLESK